MTHLKNIIEQLLETGYEILFELEKNDLDLKKVQKLYDNRSDAIEKLHEIPQQKIKHLSQEHKKPIQMLLTRVKLLEKKLNRNLAALSEIKKKDLQQVGLHKKAKSLYTQSSQKEGKFERKIIDLK